MSAINGPGLAAGHEATGAPLGFWGRLAVLFGGVLPGIGIATIAVMLPGISDAFGAGRNGLAIPRDSPALGVGMMVGAPTGGLLADRLGRKPVLLGATLVFAVFGCGMMLAGALWQLIAARFVVGIASGMIPACVIAIIGDHFGGNSRSRWLGYNGAVATLMLVALIPVTGKLADGGWQRGFAVYAFAVPILALTAVGVPRAIRSSRSASPGPKSGAFAWLPIMVALVVGTLSSGTILYWPFRLRELGVTSASGLAGFGLVNAMMICGGGLCYGLVRRRLSVRQVFGTAAAGSCLALIAMSCASGTRPVMLGLAVEGAAIGLITPNLSTFAIEMSSTATRARTVGIMQGALFGGPFVTQFALEPLSRQGGAGAALLGIAALAGAFAVLVLSPAWRRLVVSA